MNIGVGHGPSKRAGKRTASVQALEYLRSCGKDPNIRSDREGLTLKFSSTGNVMEGWRCSRLALQVGVFVVHTTLMDQTMLYYSIDLHSVCDQT